MNKSSRRVSVWLTLLALAVFTAAPTARPAFAASDPYLAVAGTSEGGVYAVNQDIVLQPSWEGGAPVYIGGQLEYTWSPQNLLVQQSEDAAVFRIPDCYDNLPLFVSADLTGVGSWIRPAALSDRVGGTYVTIVCLHKAASAGSTSESTPVTAAAGSPIELRAEWLDASGNPPEVPPQQIRYRWTAAGPEGTSAVGTDSLQLADRPNVPGSYVYTCSAIPADPQDDRVFSSVSFSVEITAPAQSQYELTLTSESAVSDGLCTVPAGETALLSVHAVPELPQGVSYQWEIRSEDSWTAIQGATESTYNAEGSLEGIQYRCRIDTGSWAGTSSVMDVRYSRRTLEVESQPYDISARAGASDIRMQTTVRYAASTVPTALWQYRQNESSAWTDARQLDWFSEDEPASVSRDLLTFSWTLNGARPSQSGQFRCIVSNDSTDVITQTALLTVFQSERQLAARSPFEVLPASTGTIVTGVQVRPINAPLDAEQLAECFILPEDCTLAIIDGPNAAAASDVVGTGRQLQLLNAESEIEDAATLVMPGDVTGSGVMNLSQLVRLAQAFSGEAPLYGPYALAADMTGDGQISLSDLVAAARLLRSNSAGT